MVVVIIEVVFEVVPVTGVPVLDQKYVVGIVCLGLVFLFPLHTILGGRCHGELCWDWCCSHFCLQRLRCWFGYRMDQWQLLSCITSSGIGILVKLRRVTTWVVFNHRNVYPPCILLSEPR